ncbi:Uncharacterised protein [uncultured archaeon]|nr:Uncharacterised protein [uncultured archaeon]
MNKSNEPINWKGNIERLLANENVQTFIFMITNLIFFSKFSIPSLLSKYFEKPNGNTVTDGIAILTVFVLAVGVLYYAGVYKERQKEYCFTNFPYNFIQKSAIIGSIFIATIILASVISEFIKLSVNIKYLHAILIMVIIFSVLSFLLTSKREDISLLKWKYHLANWEYHLIVYIIIYIIILIYLLIPSPESQILNIVAYITIISLLVILFGYEIEKHRQKISNLTLEMIDPNELIKDLELFDITDIDYRFRNSEGNEFIVPIGQVRKIIYEKTK